MDGCQIFLTAGPVEADLVATVQNESKGSATIVEATLGRLIALTRRASLMIAGVTGPRNLACALGKPVVGIFGPTDPARNGPYGCDFRVLRHPESKRDHSRRSEPEAGLLTITPEAVLAEARQLLGRVPIA
jgi:heptosyltransferase-1